MQDDAFISFRYAANLVAGHGLVWNPGERVEGYSNFLWTLLMAVPIGMGFDPTTFAWLVGLVLFPVTLWATFRMALELFSSLPLALLAVILLGTNSTFSAYATGGLETQLQTLLFLLCALLAQRVAFRCFDRGAVMPDVEARPRPSESGADPENSPAELRPGPAGDHAGLTPGGAVLFSITAAAALLTRLDSALLIAGPAAVVVFAVLRRKRPASPSGSVGTTWWPMSSAPGPTLRLLISLVAPLAAALGAWLIWKGWFYGSLLPNTFYLKAAGPASVLRGLYYVGLFLVCYALAPFPILWMLGVRRILAEVDPRSLLLLLPSAALWILYVIKIGGDFMEFRLLVPILPVLMIAIAWTIVVWSRHPMTKALLTSLVIGGSLFHAWTFDGSARERGLVSIPALARQLDAPGQDWIKIGRFLGSAIPTGAGVTIALTPAGAIPYYSRLAAVDMLGVNDAWIARHGVARGGRPGHQRIAPVRYLRLRGVNLVLSPYPIRIANLPADGLRYHRGVLETMFGLEPPPDPESFPDRLSILALPLDRERALLCLYLTPHPVVDDLIEARGWSSYALTTRKSGIAPVTIESHTD